MPFFSTRRDIVRMVPSFSRRGRSRNLSRIGQAPDDGDIAPVAAGQVLEVAFVIVGDGNHPRRGGEVLGHDIGLRVGEDIGGVAGEGKG